MKHMIKLLGLIIMLTMVLSACQPAAPAAPDKLKIALVLPGTINDNGWSQVAYDGVMAGANETGAEVAYTESSQLPDFESIYRDYANKGYNLVVGHGSEYADVALKVGKEFPNTCFAVTNADVKAENVAGLDTKNEEAGYLSGFIAGVITKTKKVAIVNAMEIVAMKRAVEGFELGVKASCPDCEFVVSWIGSFDDVGKGKETTLAVIEQGVDVVYANGDAAAMGIIAACNEKGVMIIGDTGDQTSLAPDYVVTNMMQNLTPMFVEIVKEVADGKFVPNNVRMNGFDTGIYYITPLNEKLVTEEQSAKIMAEVEKVTKNEVELPHMSASEE
jgi:basic membrane protein A